MGERGGANDQGLGPTLRRACSRHAVGLVQRAREKPKKKGMNGGGEGSGHDSPGLGARIYRRRGACRGPTHRTRGEGDGGRRQRGGCSINPILEARKGLLRKPAGRDNEKEVAEERRGRETSRGSDRALRDEYKKP